MKIQLLVAALVIMAVPVHAQLSRPAAYPRPNEGDYVIRDFRFHTGETLPELRLHYATLGTPRRDGSRRVFNAVLVMHGTGGSGRSLLTEQFAGILFAPGGLLDAARYFIILPDAIGHGKSAKPSDGLRMKFPHYTYDDMVAAQYRLLAEKLGVNHLRLVMGTSMGGMHTWVWAETHADFMDALMPLASLPVEIAGRNRMWRKMVIEDIRRDPAWNHGEYTTEPLEALSDAAGILLLMGGSPLQLRTAAPTRDKAEQYLDDYVQRTVARTDANDMIYQFDASREYNPQPLLEKIQAPLTAINSADDMINPPELGIMEQQIRRVRRGRYVLIPTSPQTRGHGTHSVPVIWQSYLKELLDGRP